MSHFGLKYSLEIKTKGLDNEKLTNSSNKIINEYLNSNKFAEDYDLDLAILTEDSIIFGFEFLNENEKLKIPEINPITIYFSNAVMSNHRIEEYKKIMIDNVRKGILQIHNFGDFFQLAFNCIINLQSAVETMVNKAIQEHHYYFPQKKGKFHKPSIHEKIDIALFSIFKRSFKNDFKIEYNLIKDLIQMRNQIIHLKPDNNITNVKYKNQFRSILSFNFSETINATMLFINYYQDNLIEECNCGTEFYFDINQKNCK